MLVHSKDNNDPEGIEKELQAYAASKKLLPHLFEGCADDALYEPQRQNNNEVDNLQTKKDENRLRYKELLGNVSAAAKFVANSPSNPVGCYQAVIDNEQNIKNVAKGVKKAAFYAGDVYDENKLGLLDNLREKLNELNSSGKIYDRNTPDSKTFAWATKNWDNAKIAYDVGFIHPKFKNISSNAHRFAGMEEKLPLNYYANNKLDQGSKRGAFRHALWQAAITSKYNDKKAEEIGDVHETTTNLDLSKRIFYNVDDADLVVDLLNNVIGRELGKRYKGQNIKSLALHLLDNYYKDGLYTAEPDNNGNWYIDKRKIDENTYMELLDLFEKADNNGFLPTSNKNINIIEIVDSFKKYAKKQAKAKVQNIFQRFGWQK